MKESRKGAKKPSVEKHRILVTEDDIIVARDIEQSLNSYGYDVIDVVTTGEDAVKTAHEKRPDLVLMDIRLKGSMDGIAAAEKIREIDIPVIYLTAYSDEKTLRRAKVTEPFGYVIKPFDERSLYTTIEMGLYKHAMEHRLRTLKEYSESILESMPLGLTVVDMGGRITTINRRQEEIFGEKSAAAFGKRMFAKYLPGLRNALSPLLEKTLKKGVSTHERGVDYEDTDGARYVLDAFISPLIEKGKITGAVIALRDVTDKTRLKEKVRLLEKKEVHQLTENDKKALYAIISNPGLSSPRLAKKLGMQRTTFVGIKNKLKRRGYYTKHRIPDLSAIGYGTLGVEFGSLSKSLTKKESDEFFKQLAGSPRRFYVAYSGSEYLSLSVAKDAAEYRDKAELLEIGLLERDKVEDYAGMRFPLSGTSPIKSLFGGDAVKACFSLEGEVPAPGKPSSPKARKLRKNELAVLSAMTRYPELPEREIAKKTSLSAVTVNSIKKRLLGDGIIRTVNVPNMKKLGCGLMLLIKLSFKPNGAPKGPVFDGLPSPLIHIEDAMEAFAAIPFRDYPEYKAAYARYAADGRLMQSLSASPRTLLLSDVRGYALDFGRLLEQK